MSSCWMLKSQVLELLITEFCHIVCEIWCDCLVLNCKCRLWKYLPLFMTSFPQWVPKGKQALMWLLLREYGSEQPSPEHSKHLDACSGKKSLHKSYNNNCYINRFVNFKLQIATACCFLILVSFLTFFTDFLYLTTMSHLDKVCFVWWGADYE
jgi:hypothetical protein